MAELDKRHLDFLKSLVELFYERIRPDTKFRNKRIKEWCDNLPLPPTSATDSNDISAIDEIARIHQQLERIDDENSVKGYRWGGYVRDEFSAKLQLLSKQIKESDVDPSIYNLFHVHNSILLRAQGQYDEAINEISKSTELLQKKIDEYGSYLPRYAREIFMNTGAASELHRLNGNIEEAIAAADEMHRLSMKESENEEYVEEDKRALCLSTSWALYYCCEAHLAVEDWDNASSKHDREWYFSHTFSQSTYEDWTVPVLIRIIGNVVWEQRYPAYFENIADLVYLGTAKGNMKRKMRETSVFFGRIRLKPTMPMTLLSLVALLIVRSAHANQQGNQATPDFKSPVVTMMDDLEKEGIQMDSEDRGKIESEVSSAIDTIVSAGLVEEEVADEETIKIADRGIGVGISKDAYHLLPQTAFASDRGVGVA